MTSSNAPAAQSAYRSEADALDAEILACIEQRTVPDFDDLALRVFAHQLRFNEPYGRFCHSLGVTLERMPRTWEAIPPVPAAAFKEAALCTFDPVHAALVFETSGTTGTARGKHYMESSTLYDAALLAGFSDAMLGDVPGRMRYLLLVPSPAQSPHSSLGYMMRRIADRCGDGQDCWYLADDALDVGRFLADAQNAQLNGVPVCIAGTAFALVQLLDGLRDRAAGTVPLPPASRIMETGGFKGRTRSVERSDLYAQLSRLFAIPQERIVAEYGMTELTSQYYDRPSTAHDERRVKCAPPWLRPRVVGMDGATVAAGVAGTLVHVDLGNRSSCIAIRTQDLGIATDDGIVLLGRAEGADLRGCSLDAEQLRELRT